MKRYTVILQEKATGRISIRHHGGSDPVGAEFRWSEGNEACDCNRRTEFELGLGNDVPKESLCSDPEKESAYRVALITDDGKLIYSEFDTKKEE